MICSLLVWFKSVWKMENFITPDLHDADTVLPMPGVLHEGDHGMAQWANTSLSDSPDWIVETILDKRVQELVV